jgi:hypothetical protein
MRPTQPRRLIAIFASRYSFSRSTIAQSEISLASLQWLKLCRFPKLYGTAEAVPYKRHANFMPFILNWKNGVAGISTRVPFLLELNFAPDGNLQWELNHDNQNIAPRGIGNLRTPCGA